MTQRQFETEIRKCLERYKLLVAAQTGIREVKSHWRKPHAVKAYKVSGHWVRRIGAEK